MVLSKNRDGKTLAEIRREVDQLFEPWHLKLKKNCGYYDDLGNFKLDREQARGYIRFLKRYGTLMIWDQGNSAVRKIKRLLKMQIAPYTNSKISICFEDGHPIQIWMNVASLSDIDIADIYGLLYSFEEMRLFRKSGRPWGLRGAAQIKQYIAEDLAQSGLVSKISSEILKNEMTVHLNVDKQSRSLIYLRVGRLLRISDFPLSMRKK